MRAKWVGVAVAAVMACGCLSGAEASPFKIAFTAGTGADGFVDATITGDTESTLASLVYSEEEQTFNLFDFISTSFSDPAAKLTLGKPQTVDEFGFKTISRSFDLSGPDKAFQVSNTDGTFYDKIGYHFDFTLALVSVAPEDPGTYFVSGLPVISSGFAGAPSVFVTGNPLSLVPLPASLPMFGTTLVGLAGLGYGLKRRSQTQAA